MRYGTACREYRPDQAPSDWTPRWGAVSADAIVRHPVGDRQPRLLIDGDGLWSWNVVDSDSNRANFDLIVGCSAIKGSPGAGQYTLVAGRASGGAGTETAYVIELDFAGKRIKLAKYVSGTRTQIGLQVDPAWALVVLGEPFFLRFQAIGTALKARMWTADRAQPTSWDINATDSAITAAGWIGVALDTTFVDAQVVRYFSVGTGGDSPYEASVARHPADLVKVHGAKIEWAADLDFVARSDGSSKPLRASTHGRVLPGQDLPASVAAQRYLLRSPRTNLQLAGDLEHDGDARGAFNLTLRNRPRAALTAGPLDDREGDTIAGRDVAVLAGEADAPHWRSLARIVTAKGDGNPKAEGDRLIVSALSSSRRLDRKLDVNRYVGIPSCVRQMSTAMSGETTAPHISAYDLTSYTLCCRFRLESFVSSNHLLRKDLSLSDQNWWWRVQPSTRMFFHYSIGGAGTEILKSEPNLVQLDTWHWAVVGLLEGEYAYMLLDGELIAENTSPGTPDTQTASVIMTKFGDAGLQECDARIISGYLAPDEARQEMSRIPTSAPSNYAAWWLFNESSGATVTDYSSNANHATISGVENTDWERYPTDLGEEEQAGAPMPISHGDLDHTKAELIDRARERYRLNDRALVAPYGGDNAGELYSRGVVVTETEEGDGVVSFASAQDRPVTAQSLYGLDGEHPTTIPDLAAEVLTQRGGLVSTDFDQAALERMRELLPWGAGWAHSGEPPSAAAALREILKPSGLHVREDPWGRIVFDRLHPPMTPGPSSTACMEVMGTHLLEASAPALIFGGVGAIPSSQNLGCYIRCWVYPMPRASRNVLTWSGQPPGVILAEHNFAIGYMYDSLLPFFSTPGVQPSGGGNEYLIGTQPLVPWTWNYLHGQLEFLQRKLWTGPVGAPQIHLTQDTGNGTLTGEENVLKICGGSYPFVGGIQDVESHDPLGTTQFVPLSEGSGFAEETTSGVKCALRGARWAPVLELDLSKELGLSWSFLRTLQPASSIEVGHTRNWARLSPSDLAASVTDAEEQRFTRQELVLTWTAAAEPGSSKRPREIVVSTPAAAAGAEQVLSSLAARFGPDGRRYGKLAGLGHRVLGLQEGDEIRVKDHRYGLSAGRSMRVVARDLEAGAVLLEG